jgi:hypothetical protein
MSSLQMLPPDQRAVLQLLLQKDRSYDEIAQLLRLDAQTIRGRAHAAVAALGPDTPGLSDEQRGELTDYLLGEQSASSRAATRAFLEGSPPARAWSRAAADELRPLGGDRLPEIPADPAGAPPAPAPEPPAPAAAPEPEPVLPAAATAAPASGVGAVEKPADLAPVLPPQAAAGAEAAEPAAEPTRIAGPTAEVAAQPAKTGPRIGGMLVVFGIAAVIAVVVILALRGLGGDDESDQPVATTPAPAVQTVPTTEPETSTTTPTGATPQVDAEIQMRPPSGGEARATATLITQSGRESIAIAGQNLQPTTDRAFYGLWFANSRSDAVFLGYAPPVTENGRMRLFDALPEATDPLQYEEIWLTRETVTEDTTTPSQPGQVALSGPIGD